uniref:IRG-type G domain-containing protein n=1 Tax=Sphenodon punctatus TaxID=8508 RepID=A0A8D0HFU9_SPHPU
MDSKSSKEETGKWELSAEDTEKLKAGKLSPEDMEKLKNALESGDLPAVAAKLKKELESLEKTTLNIAVTGESGAGKSSFVNAIRGLGDDDDGAAETGVRQTTMKPDRYLHPDLPNVTVWDLPGIGTPEFNPDQCLEMENFSCYDFFIIISSERFKIHDVKLAHAIQGMKKRFYYVRSKVDADLYNEKMKKKNDFNEEKTLETIRTDCIDNLRKAGESSPRVFLISRWDLSKYDFPLLQKTLEEELDDHKRHVFMLSLPNISKEILKKKKSALKKYIWQMAFLSCAIGAAPIPGLSLACDIGILVSSMIRFCRVFGLDYDSLARLAKQVGKPVEELRSAVKKSPMARDITKEFVISLLSKSVVGTLYAVELALNFVPVLGTLTGGGLSFATTFKLLTSFLNDAEEDAQNVVAKVLEPKATMSE